MSPHACPEGQLASACVYQNSSDTAYAPCFEPPSASRFVTTNKSVSWVGVASSQIPAADASAHSDALQLDLARQIEDVARQVASLHAAKSDLDKSLNEERQRLAETRIELDKASNDLVREQQAHARALSTAGAEAQVGREQIVRYFLKLAATFSSLILVFFANCLMLTHAL